MMDGSNHRDVDFTMGYHVLGSHCFGAHQHSRIINHGPMQYCLYQWGEDHVFYLFIYFLFDTLFWPYLRLRVESAKGWERMKCCEWLRDEELHGCCQCFDLASACAHLNCGIFGSNHHCWILSHITNFLLQHCSLFRSNHHFWILSRVANFLLTVKIYWSKLCTISLISAAAVKDFSSGSTVTCNGIINTPWDHKIVVDRASFGTTAMVWWAVSSQLCSRLEVVLGIKLQS